MSDIKTLSDRIDVLETRLTFQDETIETLNKTITAQWLQDRRADAPGRGLERTAAGGRGARARRGNEPPPHY